MDQKTEILNPDTLWTAKELAGYLKCSEHTIRDKTYRRRIPFIKIPGGGVRYRKEEIDEWLIEKPIRKEGSRVSKSKKGVRDEKPIKTVQDKEELRAEVVPGN